MIDRELSRQVLSKMKEDPKLIEETKKISEEASNRLKENDGFKANQSAAKEA